MNRSATKRLGSAPGAVAPNKSRTLAAEQLSRAEAYALVTVTSPRRNGALATVLLR